MKKETEENIKMIWSIFAIIGIFSTLIFIYELFDKDDNTSVCIEYELKIEELEDEISKGTGLDVTCNFCQKNYHLNYIDIH